jgi:hypothetical protein
VRELTAHALRAYTTIEMYVVAEPTVDRLMADAAEYYRVVLSDPAIHASVAKRARDAAADLSDPIGESEATAERVLALCASTADDDPVNSFAGQITFSEYLASRTVELSVHTLDIQRACGLLLAIHPSTASVVLSVLGELANPALVILALTGRQALPPDYNVLG